MNRIKKTFPKMDRSNRAKQFMPFDALKGFREALAEKERQIVSRKILSEEQKEELDFKLYEIHRMDMVTVEYFRDGEYVNITGNVTKIDRVGRNLTVGDVIISFEDICSMSGSYYNMKKSF